MLDAILDNETELTILEYTTDTAGYTELVFALFDLLGMQFTPRIRDLGDQRLHRFDSEAIYCHLGPLLKGKVRERRTSTSTTCCGWLARGSANQASCLNLVTNAVIVWNTVYGR